VPPPNTTTTSSDVSRMCALKTPFPLLISSGPVHLVSAGQGQLGKCLHGAARIDAMRGLHLKNKKATGRE
jgi:hypothetical protein